jgi:thiamine-phosphate pyrophosphorylase
VRRPGLQVAAPSDAPEGFDPQTCRLYLITPQRLVAGGLEVGEFLPELIAAIEAADVACVQLRLKDVDDDTVRRTAKALRGPVQERGVAFLINDRPDLAAAIGADGVHVGQGDADYATARRLVGADAIVGVTCHDSRHLAMVAAEDGADYVAFGAFYPSSTKERPAGHPDLEILSWWNEIMTVPCVAIGGITPANCGPLVAAGADFLAVSAAVWDHPDGAAASVRAFMAAIAVAQAAHEPA